MHAAQQTCSRVGTRLSTRRDVNQGVLAYAEPPGTATNQLTYSAMQWMLYRVLYRLPPHTRVTRIWAPPEKIQDRAVLSDRFKGPKVIIS